MPGELYRVVTFRSTFDAIEAERLCHAAGVPGRIVPVPPRIDAECGLAWRMPPSAEARRAFDAAVAGAVEPAAYLTLAW